MQHTSSPSLTITFRTVFYNCFGLCSLNCFHFVLDILGNLLGAVEEMLRNFSATVGELLGNCSGTFRELFENLFAELLDTQTTVTVFWLHYVFPSITTY